MFEITQKLDSSCFAQPRPVAMLSVGGNLMPLSWHMPMSKEPFMYGIAVRDENYTHDLLKKHKEFSLNFLDFTYRDDYKKLGDIHGQECDKFALSGFSKKEATHIKSNLIEEAYMIYECKLKDILSYGDHDIFVGEVVLIHNKKNAEYLPTLFMGKKRYNTIQNIET